MTKKPTALHHKAGHLNHLICQRKWHKAYEAADEMDTVIIQEETGNPLTTIYTFCTITDIAEERFKRASYAH